MSNLKIIIMKPKNGLFCIKARCMAVLAIMPALLLAMVSCKDETPAKEATVSLKVTATSSSSISFEAVAENAVSVSYAVYEQGSAAEDYASVEIDGSPIKITEGGLSENTKYIITAYATNADGKKGPETSIDAVTSSQAKVDIEIVETTSSSVKFILAPLNAASMKYAVAESSEDVRSIELDNAVEASEETEVETRGLMENTSYTVVALAVNSGGEESERAFSTFRTEIEPLISIETIDAEYNQATVGIVAENAVEYAYCCVEKDAPAPEEQDYSRHSLDGSSVSFILTQLEPLTEYSVYAYGINSKGYSGAPVSKDFITEEYVTKPFEIKISDVTSTDAAIEVSIDKDLYSKYYFVAAPASMMYPSSEDWDWEEIITQGYSSPQYQEYSENMNFTFRTWTTDYFLERGGMYTAGGVPVKKDGSLDAGAAVWQSVVLPEVVIGEKDFSVEITGHSVSYSEIRFGMNISADAKFIYVYNLEGFREEGSAGFDEMAANTVTTYPISCNGGAKDTVISYLSPSKDYTLMVVPKDSDGRLGNAAWLNYRTKSLEDIGDAEGSALLKDMGLHEAVFDISLGKNASAMLYKFQVYDEWFDEQAFLNSLKINNYSRIENSGEFRIENLVAEKDYVFGFAPVGEDGMTGEHMIIYETTDSYACDGNPDADVSVEILSCEYNGWAYVTSVSAVPNEHVSKYYVGVRSSENKNLSNGEFIDGCMNGFYTEYVSDAVINEIYSMDSAELIVVVYDEDGKLSAVKEVSIDKTWN